MSFSCTETHTERGKKFNDFGTSFRPDLALNFFFFKLNFNVPIDGMMTDVVPAPTVWCVPGPSDANS